MKQGCLLHVCLLFCYSVKIWSKTMSLTSNHISSQQEKCDDTVVVATTTSIPFISSQMEHALYKVKSTEICSDCTEAVFERIHNRNTSMTTFNIDLSTQGHHNKGKLEPIPHVIVTISPLVQNAEEVITINFATKERYTSSTVCVKSVSQVCDALVTFPLVSSQGRDIHSISYAITLDASQDMVYYVVYANGEIQTIYYSTFHNNLNSYKMAFQMLGTSADVTYTSSVKALSDIKYSNMTSFSSISHGNCNSAKPYCDIMPSCLEISDLCYYETETENDEKVYFHKSTSIDQNFIYNVEYHSILELIKLDLEGISGQLSFIGYNQYLLDFIEISNTYANDGSLQLNFHFNPEEEFNSKNAMTIHLSNLCTPFSIVVILKESSSCHQQQEPPKIFIFIEDKMILLGYMRSRYTTLNMVKVGGPLKVLDVETVLNENCKTPFSISVSIVVVSIVIVLLIALLITLFLRRIKKENENMAFLVNPTISHHADKEYSKSAARNAIAKAGQDAGKIDEEIELDSIHNNVYYEE